MYYHIHLVTLFLIIVIDCTRAVITNTFFTSPYGSDVRSTMTSLYTVHVRSVIECSMTCQNEALCRGTNYVRGTGNCELIKVYTTAEDVATSVGIRYIMGPGM
jgi:hypothetical protein